MAEILITGMEMPKEGHCISIFLCGDGTVTDRTGNVIHATAQELLPHGDLIARSELLREIEAMLSNPNVMIGIDSIMDKIRLAPAVIPASEGEG